MRKCSEKFTFKCRPTLHARDSDDDVGGVEVKPIEERDANLSPARPATVMKIVIFILHCVPSSSLSEFLKNVGHKK